MERLRIIVTGLIAQHYSLGGVTWDYIQYIIGLHRMGHEVFYFEDSGEWPYPPDGGASGNELVASDCRPNTSFLGQVLERYGLKDRWAYHFPTRPEWFGLSERRRKSIIRSADLLINVSGTLEFPDRYAQVKRLVYIDTDPGFTQVKIKMGDKLFRQRIDAHQVHFSFGERLPPHLQVRGLKWQPTRTPIVMDLWPLITSKSTTYNTIMSWTSYKPLVHDGIAYLQKDAEFIKYLELPSKCRKVNFEIAMGKMEHDSWRSEVIVDKSARVSLRSDNYKSPWALLADYGWKVVDSGEKCGNPDNYRDYIINSRGEWSVAKGGYVTAYPGWFSCRSACYLAAGRPVVVQDTGFGAVLPVGEGIVPFNSLVESVKAIEAVECDYEKHSKRAREIAGDYFNAERVLTRLLERSLK